MGRLPSLDTLRVFSVAARHLSFTKAADELHLTQSAISHRVRALEEELGVLLFNRLTRKLTLTSAGQALAQSTVSTKTARDRGSASPRCRRSPRAGWSRGCRVSTSSIPRSSCR